MGNNSFAPYEKLYTSFIVKNIITKDNKVVRIFQYPIPVGKERDLLAIPGVSESDIRASLLKGELLHKLLAGEISVTTSDIDLLQFNAQQKALLLAAGITVGLDVSGLGYITASDHQVLRQLIHFIDSGGPADGFTSGAYKEILPSGAPFPTSITWWADSGKTAKIVEKLITYNANDVPITIVWNMYAVDGITIVHSVTDTITYFNSVFEANRVRTIT